MMWALIVMSCTRFCEPMYVELYSTKAGCEKRMVEPKLMQTKLTYCRPAVPQEKQ